MITIRIEGIHVDPEPEVFELPDGYLPEFVHELAQIRERRYRQSHFKTVVKITGLPEEEGLPVREYARKQHISQTALALVNGGESA